MDIMLSFCKNFSRLIVFVGVIFSGYGQVVLDGTLGPSGALTGPNFDITADLGKQVGSNLFHSFSEFNLLTIGAVTESATFTGPDNVQNIISRVTGDNLSVIDGTIRSDIQDANLLFLNPNGVIFGQNASLDVTGSFAVSTADYVGLADGGRFDASNPDNDILTSAPISAFGFLDQEPIGGISVIGDLGVSCQGSVLSVSPSQSLTLIGGDLTIANGGCLQAPAGEVNAVSVGSEGEVIVKEEGSSTEFETQSFSMLGNIAILESDINVSSSGGGEIFIGAKDLVMADAQILADTMGARDGKGISIGISGRLNLQNGSRLSAITTGSGNGGNITINAQTINLDRLSSKFDTGIFANTDDISAGGKGGNIFIETGDLEVLNGAIISATTSGSGDGGEVVVSAENIIIDNRESTEFTGFLAQSQQSINGGSGGDITLKSQNLEVINGGEINISTFGNGDGGRIDINSEVVTIDDKNSPFPTGISAATLSKTEAGTGGEINVNAISLEVFGGAQISATTFGIGNGGGITINAESIYIDKQNSESFTGISTQVRPMALGRGGAIKISSKQLRVSSGAEIRAMTFSEGSGGDLTLMIDEDIEVDQARIGTVTTEAGNGGNVHIQANEIKIKSAEDFLLGGISAISEFGATGNAGNLDLIANNIQIFHSGEISTSTFGTGNAGHLTIEANDILINGQDQGGGILSITRNPGQGGRGGNLALLKIDNLEVVNGGIISSTTEGLGNAGDISIEAKDILIDRQNAESITGIITEGLTPLTEGNAGNLNLFGVSKLNLTNGGVISSSTFGSGAAGSFAIEADEIKIDGQGVPTGIRSLSASLTEVGIAGDVDLIGIKKLEILNFGFISATTFGPGNGGDISIQADKIILNGENGGAAITSVSFNPNQGGDAGDVTLTDVSELNISEGGLIATNTFGLGAGGNLTIEGMEIFIDGKGSNISTQSNSEIQGGRAGDLNLIGLSRLGCCQ